MDKISKSERTLFKKLNTPQKIQDYLDRLPMRYYKRKDTLVSPRRVIREKKAHCMEGALFAAAALWYHGRPPLLLDLKTEGWPTDYDHVVALFKENGYFGAISKTNHVGLRYRDPIYKTLRELALSYFHEYFNDSGKKTLESYSKPFFLLKLGDSWITREGNLWDIERMLDKSPHVKIIPKTITKKLRRASDFERQVAKLEEWGK